MASIPIHTRVSGGSFAALLSRLSDMTPAMAEVPGIIRKSVQAEFEAQAWRMPQGGLMPWPVTKPFGNVAAHPSMVLTGAYRRALLGGAGAVTITAPLYAQVAVSAQQFPSAALLRGLQGGRVDLTGRKIKPKKTIRLRNGQTDYAMRYYLGLTFGVWISRARLLKGLELLPRPHLTRNPQMDLEIGKVMLRWITGGSW